MKANYTGSSFGGRAGIVGAALLGSFAAQANPIVLPEKPIAPEITFLLGSALLLEVACVWMVLRLWGKPRLFVLWLVGMHALTYPGFMALLGALDELRPKSAVAAPSAVRCGLALLIGNAGLAAAFPIVNPAFERFGPR